MNLCRTEYEALLCTQLTTRIVKVHLGGHFCVQVYGKEAAYHYDTTVCQY